MVFKWLKHQGGLKAIAEVNTRKAAKLYDAIDNSGGFYSNPVIRSYRSIMNVPFVLADASLEKTFLKDADDRGLLNLAGHRAVGWQNFRRRPVGRDARPRAGVWSAPVFDARLPRLREPGVGRDWRGVH